MCTATIIPLTRPHETTDTRATAGVRFAFNRDESRARPAGLPPQRGLFGRHGALMPLDPVSDGTWIAVSDAGLAMALMNVYEGKAGPDDMTTPRPAAYQSRGIIIPSLLSLDHFDAALDAALSIEAGRYPPFRLLLLDRRDCAAVQGDGRTMALRERVPIDRPILFTSSGLGDDIVGTPRRALFDKFFAEVADWSAKQDAFHRHAWPDSPHLSVCMSRPEARTVSHAVIEVDADTASLSYIAAFPESADASHHSLRLTRHVDW